MGMDIQLALANVATHGMTFDKPVGSNSWSTWHPVRLETGLETGLTS